MKIRDKIVGFFNKQPEPRKEPNAKNSKVSRLRQMISSKQSSPDSKKIEKGTVSARQKDEFREISAVVQEIMQGSSQIDNPLERRTAILSEGMLKIQEMMLRLPEEMAKREIVVLARELEKMGPSIIRDAVKELQDLNNQYFKLSGRRSKGNEALKAQIGENKKALEGKIASLNASLMSCYTQFADIRTVIADKGMPFDERTREALLTAHHYLSRAMNQSSVSPGDSVEFPFSVISKVKTLGLVLGDRYSRGKIREGVGILAKGIAGAAKNAVLRHVFRDQTREKPSVTMNNAKVAMTNSLVALGLALARNVFGPTLLGSSRNVVRTSDTEKRNDIIAQKVLEQKMHRAEHLVTQVKKTEMDVTSTKSITDGVCWGRTLFEALQVVRNPNEDAKTEFLAHATKNANGAPPEAQAHQAIYEAMKGEGLNIDLCEKIMLQQQAYALDAQDGVGVYKANFTHVKESYAAVLKGVFTGLNNDSSPLAKAVNAALVASKDSLLPTSRGEHYIRDLPQFKAKVLEGLKEIRDPEARLQAENELEWLIGNLELRFAYNYVAGYASPFIPLADVDLAKVKEECSTVGCLRVVSNPAIRMSLDHMIGEESGFNQQQAVARARGADLVRMEHVLGFSFGQRNDSEMLDRMNHLPDGVYIFSIELQSGGHAMTFYKSGDIQYLSDPNLGVIDCSHGTHKAQITKLIRSMEFMYPRARVQGPNSDGTSHNINLLQVKDARKKHPDLLEGVKYGDYTLVDGEAFNKKAVEESELAMKDLIQDGISKKLQEKLLKHVNFDVRKVKEFVKKVNAYAANGNFNEVRGIFTTLGIEEGSKLHNRLLKELKAMEKSV